MDKRASSSGPRRAQRIERRRCLTSPASCPSSGGSPRVPHSSSREPEWRRNRRKAARSSKILSPVGTATARSSADSGRSGIEACWCPSRQVVCRLSAPGGPPGGLVGGEAERPPSCSVGEGTSVGTGISVGDEGGGPRFSGTDGGGTAGEVGLRGACLGSPGGFPTSARGGPASPVAAHPDPGSRQHGASLRICPGGSSSRRFRGLASLAVGPRCAPTA